MRATNEWWVETEVPVAKIARCSYSNNGPAFWKKAESDFERCQATLSTSFFISSGAFSNTCFKFDLLQMWTAQGFELTHNLSFGGFQNLLNHY